jgi:peptidoglycan/xylan/chitin deacetylase (PgdA/CDA1 family)
MIAVSAEPDFDSTVLIYHRFGENEYPTTNVGVERFREQMAYLAANNFQVIPLVDLITALRKKKTLPEKSVVITIDDGYKSVYRQAWPILKSHGYPFTVFINAKIIDSGFSNYMNWDEVRELHENGIDIQDHSYAHNRLADRPRGMNESDYRNWIRDDLSKNSKTISGKLGVKPGFLAIPYGEYNQQVMGVARQLGYEAILTQDPGSVSEATDPHLIPREAILGGEWATMAHFKKILRRVDLPVTDMHPPYGEVGEAPDSYSVRLVHPDRYESDSFAIYVSELGWLEPQLQGDKLVASGGVKLSRKLNRVMVKAREKKSGKTAVRSWLLVRPENL